MKNRHSLASRQATIAVLAITLTSCTYFVNKTQNAITQLPDTSNLKFSIGKGERIAQCVKTPGGDCPQQNIPKLEQNGYYSPLLDDAINAVPPTPKLLMVGWTVKQNEMAKIQRLDEKDRAKAEADIQAAMEGWNIRSAQLKAVAEVRKDQTARNLERLLNIAAGLPDPDPKNEIQFSKEGVRQYAQHIQEATSINGWALAS
jgi:hypothetical protein